MRDKPYEKLPAEFTPALLNDLYRLERKTDVRQRDEVLLAEMKKLGLSTDHYKTLLETFAVVLGASYVFLDAYPGGAESSKELWAENSAEIRKWSPWLDDDNFAHAEYQSGYYAWHDGLVKSS